MNVVCTELWGEKRLEPVSYWIEKRKGWLTDRYYVCSEFGSFGPFNTRAKAVEMLNAMGGKSHIIIWPDGSEKTLSAPL